MCKKQLETIPDRVNDLYETSLQRVKEQDSERADVGLKILRWVLHAIRPLRVEELRHALATESEDEFFDAEGMINTSWVLGTTKGLITLQMNERAFVHHTALEYLSALDTEIFPGVEEEIANTCITYLKMRDFSLPCDRYELNVRCENFAFLQYAALHWGYHANKSSGTRWDAEMRQNLEPGALQLGSLQVIFSKVLNILSPARSIKWRLTQLQMAIVCNLDRQVEELLTDSCEDILEVKAYKGQTALHIAARVGSVSAVKLLLQHGANVNALTSRGKTALDVVMEAPYLRTSLEVAELENKAMSVPTWKNSETSAEDRRLLMDLVPLTTEKIQGAQKLGNYTMDKAAWQRSTSVVLRGGIKMDISDDDEAIVSLLLDHGVDLDSPFSLREHTALQLASIYGRTNIVRKLLTAGANPFVTKELGWNAQQLATISGHTEIALLLEERMRSLHAGH